VNPSPVTKSLPYDYQSLINFLHVLSKSFQFQTRIDLCVAARGLHLLRFQGFRQSDFDSVGLLTISESVRINQRVDRCTGQLLVKTRQFLAQRKCLN